MIASTCGEPVTQRRTTSLFSAISRVLAASSAPRFLRSSTASRLRWASTVSGQPFSTMFFAMPWPMSPTPMKPTRSFIQPPIRSSLCSFVSFAVKISPQRTRRGTKIMRVWSSTRLRAHIRFGARTDYCLQRVDRSGRGQEQRAEARAAPGEIGDFFGDEKLADQRARGRKNPDAARRRHPDVSGGVAFHAVRDAGLRLGADAGGEDLPSRERAVGRDRERADQRLLGVVDVELFLVGREAQAVRLVEQFAVDEKLERAVRRTVDALEAELARAFDAEARHAAIPGIGEIDRTVGAHADVVRAVELLALETGCQDLPPAIRLLAHERRRRVLADDEVEVGVVGHAVALVGGSADFRDAARRVPSPPDVARHVGEQQIALERMPDGALGELEPGRDPLDRRVEVDQVREARADGDMCHGRRLTLSPPARAASRRWSARGTSRARRPLRRRPRCRSSEGPWPPEWRLPPSPRWPPSCPRGRSRSPP